MSTFIRHLIRETYAQSQIFFALGVEPDDVFVEVGRVLNVDPPGALCVSVILRKDGLSCSYTVDRVSEAQGKTFLAELERFTREEKPKKTRAELDEMVRGSKAWGVKVKCLSVLILKGFHVGEMPREWN